MMDLALKKAVSGEHLEKNEAEAALKDIMDGEASDSQIASFLTAMHMKGETAIEIAAFARIIRSYATKLENKPKGPLVDTCGTGGDGSNTFNISTASAIVAAASDTKVVKHGNRSVSSRCGSADVLEKLGVPLSLTKEESEEVLKEVGMVFLYAPKYHSAMKNAMNARQDIGFKTFFNIIGPLTNPADADRQLLGVFSPELTDKIARVLKDLGIERALVVHGDGLDEITVTGKTKISELKDNQIETYYITPSEIGVEKHPLKSIKGGDTQKNAEILKKTLKGKTKGPLEIVLANSGAAIYLSGKSKSIEEGVEIARNTIETGKATKKLNKLRKATKNAKQT
ncbi:anthranilate phosphoribosyltransferase [Methanonatronarchaeum sp. AMET6-2]|uniref:anthranilate phosphoribosyltransferase n=1 Tax=Methanonatronarchaeum sp. AMET6-2 TaxID=2933293 RepID=UPI00120B8454|nr:anthranilate phosphoribosyltransferase [Methanonatronarchaeum sp. AMET6-2]RZN61826.1 MAG: anthranilate phosphoribosyltransferase [Methanonatronarchaeia archaeon]UOY09698.1 anthranilate phosphoribosyltransferase [Methanonatronarchaeum sp. AMET6-2]